MIDLTHLSIVGPLQKKLKRTKTENNDTLGKCFSLF